MLTDKLTDHRLHAKHTVEDTDPLIISTAIDLAEQGGTGVIVGEHINLLVILTAQKPPEPFCNIFLLNPGKGKDNLLYSPSNYTSVQKTGTAFVDPDTTPDQVAETGGKFIVTLYTGVSTKLLIETRLELFQRALLKSDISMACLPSTEAAARHHYLRVYFLVQVWKNIFLDPQQWSWKTTKHGPLPNATDQPAAPQEMLNKISCTCVKGCQTACSYRKTGIKYSVTCTQCKEHTCINSSSEDVCLQVDVTSYEEEVDITEDRLTFDPFLYDELNADNKMVQAEELEGYTPNSSSSKRTRKQLICCIDSCIELFDSSRFF
ncbi:hypothetical protein PR048_005127 [Dryococelus australis]|uniref:Uncharacterized protein n=1 Tax=Dryococelus australis TaxID=614101 RepID=A0ABQ9I7C2_9NEOP|nr:hypothetical protein PR048_005127 [Dryococelus australis]